MNTEPTLFSSNQIMHPNIASSLSKSFFKYHEAVEVVLTTLMTPISKAFDSPPTELIAILQKRYPNAKASQFQDLLVYPSKIRDFALTVQEILTIDSTILERDYGVDFLVAIDTLDYLSKTPVTEMFKSFSFPLTAEPSIQSSLDKFKSENSLGFIFRSMIFSKILFPIYNDPYKAPLGYVKIKEMENVTQPFLFHCPIPYYDEVVGIYPAYIQIILFAFQHTLVEICKNTRTGVSEIQNKLEETKQQLAISNNNKFVEFVSPYNWS